MKKGRRVKRVRKSRDVLAEFLLPVEIWTPRRGYRERRELTLSLEGQQVVLAERRDVDISDDHHLLVVLSEDGVVDHVCRNDMRTESEY